MADRIGVIRKGEIILVEEKAALMKKLGKKRLTFFLKTPIDELPAPLAALSPEVAQDNLSLVFTLDTRANDSGVADLMKAASSLDLRDIETHESSLEDIFVELTHE